MKTHLQLYFTENWDELLNYLHRKIEHFGMIGNSVELTRSLCQFGCYNLLISNHHTADIIYKFIKKEYDLQNIGPLETASVTRFLALYSVFAENINQALSYYKESQQLFWSLDLFEEEAMMLSEAYEWLYIWINNQEEMHYCIQRMSFLQGKLDTNILQKIEHFPIIQSKDSAYYFWNLIMRSSKINDNKKLKNRKYYGNTIPSLWIKLIDSYNEDDQLQQIAFTLLAQANQFKHPFYKAYSYFLVGNALKNESYLFIAKDLFLKTTLRDFAQFCNAEQKISKINEPKKFTFKLFHNFEVYYGDKHIPLNKWERKKAEELLLFLLIQPNLQASKDVIIEEFYPEDDYKKASNRLYVLIHTINNKIRSIIEHENPFMSIVNGLIKIDKNCVEEIDVHSYLKLVSVGNLLWSDDQEAAVELLQKARKIYNKQILPHLLYSSWLEQFKDDIQNKYIKMLNLLLMANSEEVNKDRLYMELIECDPLNEDSVKKYVAYLQEKGNQAAAKEVYQKYAQALKEDIGLDVSAELKSLMGVIE